MVLLLSSNPHVFYDIDSSCGPGEIVEKENPSHTRYQKNNENVLLDPPAGSHIILIYENQYDLDNAISTYINEGLKRDQMCVHASVSLRNRGYLDIFSKNYKLSRKSRKRKFEACRLGTLLCGCNGWKFGIC